MPRPITVRVKRLPSGQGLPLPTRMTAQAAGFDLPAAVAGPVVTEASPVEVLVGAPRLMGTLMRPPGVVADAVLVEALPTAVFPPLLALAEPALFTLAPWLWPAIGMTICPKAIGAATSPTPLAVRTVMQAMATRRATG